MEADDSSRGVTPEQDLEPPETERNEHQSIERVLGSDLMATEGRRLGIHEVLDQIEVIASPVLQFTHKWREIHEEYAALQSLLKKRAVELDLKESSVKERLKEVEERERKVDLLEKSMALRLEEKDNEKEVKQHLVSSLLTRLDCETASETEMVLEEIERLSKCNDERSRELDKAVEEFDLKQKEWVKQLEDREKELTLLEEAIKGKVNELEKKEEIFEAEQKAKDEEMDVKEKQLEEREKELELKQRELEQVMDKLKEKEKVTATACLASASASSPQQRDNACEEETEKMIPDSEFHNFKKKMESSFVADKIWALYDPQDEMPRLYAKIKRVIKFQSSLSVTWLDPKEDESVPVACGRFKYGRTETASYLAFSHEVKPTILGKNIYVNPKEGETWAVFRDRSQIWGNKPPYRYDLVEVVEVFKGHQGVGVTYLGKVEGFVSVFKHGVQHGVIKKVIAPEEMQRFSHRVPSFRLNGEEKEGVPAGSFELDPAAVPSYILHGEKEPDVPSNYLRLKLVCV